MSNAPLDGLLKQFRSVIFSGMEFNDGMIKKFSGQFPGTDISQAINMAKSQMEPASLPNVGFDKIVKLHTSRERIIALMDSHTEYLLNEITDNSEQPFNQLSGSFERSNQNKDKITTYIKHLEDRARKQETKDTKDRLFETVRDFAQWCKEFLLNAKYEPIYPVLTRNYSGIISKIEKNVSKVGISIIAYRDLAEECYSLLGKKANDGKDFQYVLALINLRCAGLGINIPSVSSIVACPKCGDKEQSGNICNKCSAYIKCPGCKQTIGKDAKICSGCGVQLDQINTYLSQIKEADKKMAAGDYETTEQLIQPVKTIWAKNENVAALVGAITDLRTKVADSETKMDECMARSEYFAAQRLVDEIKRKAVLSARLKEKEKDILQKIAQAKTFVGTGDKHTAATQKADSYAQAISMVADYDEAINKLKHQNIPVANLACTTRGKTVQLSWAPITCSSLAVKYILNREDLTNRTAKTEITRVSSVGYADTIESGISYIYYVQVHYSVSGTDMSGVWDEARSQEVIVSSEVTGYRATVGDRQVRIEFTPVDHAVDYELYRAGGNGQKEAVRANLRSGSLTDTGLSNDVRYTYTLVALFRKSSGETVRSAGIEIYATPIVPPQPVQLLNYTKNGESVTLDWDNHGKSNDHFRVLHSAKRMNKPAGFTMLLADLEKSGKTLVPLTSSKTECVLLNHVVKNYFSIWSIFGDTAIAGAEIEVLNVTEVSNPKTYISSGKLYVEWDWPSNCKQVQISYSNGSHTDPHRIVKCYPRELYDKQKAFVIQPLMDKDYYIEIATQNFEGSQEMVSSGVRVKLANSNPMTIKYSLKASTFLGKKLILTIENDNKNSLPEMVLVSTPNRIPARKEDGATVHVIPEGTACGTIKLPSEHIRKNYYARLFLTDTSIRNIKVVTPDKEYLKLY